ncbi:MAG: TIGR03943 family putative permease subunit [Actinomycetota bacterium]
MSRDWNPVRLAAGGVLAAWAAVFWFLLLSGRSAFYLSPRTAWVVPLGAALLTAAAFGRIASARAPHSEPFTRRHAGRLALILLPVIAILTLPPVALGSYAAERRSLAGAGFSGATLDVSTSEITLGHVARAMWSREAMAALASRAGSEVSFVGIVTRRDDTPADEFFLTRFIISCCVADALTVQVRIMGAPPGEFKEDEWVQVTGSIFPIGQDVVVEASKVERIPQPGNPYLTP